MTSSAPYLEHYLDSLENLPVELQRNFTLMLDLDSRTKELMRGIDKSADNYMSNINGLSSDKKTDAMVTIQRQFDKAKEYCDDKVQLAIQTYELVDKHIRKLDSDLARFEIEIQDKAISTASRNVEDSSQKRGRKKIIKDYDTKNTSGSSEEKAVTKNSKKKSSKNGKTTSVTPNKTSSSALTNSINSMSSIANVAVKTGPLSGSLVGVGVTHSAEVLDMPVDPNEPTYCLCNQVSYGEMIGCDNPDCPIEWFHFACVKLTTKPKGKWFCPKCIPDKKKK